MAARNELDETIQKTIRLTFTDAIIEKQEVIQTLWSGYGKIVRVFLSQVENVPSVVVKCVVPPTNESGLSHDRKCRSYIVEQFFYDHYASHLNPSECKIPTLLYSDTSCPTKTLFVLQDLNSIGFSQRRLTLAFHDAELCIIWLARFHRTFLQPNQLLIESYNSANDRSAQNIGGVWEQGCYWHLSTRPDEHKEMDDRDPLKAKAQDIDLLLRNAKYKTLLHGDAKIDNFCWSEDDDMVAAVDFQYTGWGVGISDVANFLRKLPDDLKTEENEALLLDLYFKSLSAGPDLEAEWRQLYCVAVADIERFLAGWSRTKLNSSWDRTGHIGDLVAQALSLV